MDIDDRPILTVAEAKARVKEAEHALRAAEVNIKEAHTDLERAWEARRNLPEQGVTITIEMSPDAEVHPDEVAERVREALDRYHRNERLNY